MKKLRQNTNNYKLLIVILLFILAALTCLCLGCTQTTQTGKSLPISSTSKEDNLGMKHYDGYELEQSTVLSRHNIRAAVDSGKPSHKDLTPHEWIDWTAQPGELTLQGSEEETIMGTYFRSYYESENLIPKNWVPENDQAYVYSNAYQRTIATAKYFSAGMFPTTNINVVYNGKVGDNDPIFKKNLDKAGKTTEAKILEEIDKLDSGKGLDGMCAEFGENYKLIEKVLDFKNSKYAKENNMTEFRTDDTKVEIKKGQRPIVSGSVNIVADAIDALRLQYYLTPNDKEAAFGNDISYSDWEKISDVLDASMKAKVGTHTEGVITSNLLLAKLQEMIQNPNRKFSFTCAHDTTIMGVNAALRVKEYKLPNAISTQAPIGCKLVINKWKDKTGEEYCSLSMVYASVDQLRNHTILKLDNPPMEYTLELEGLDKNKDGLYRFSDVNNRISETIAEYDMLD